ncbi:hypothetical protein Q7C36_017710 [Tachysurus vachellii]|uniref:Uncharacterized protein n=1 Tax=Tachysurus vachellii TaxID=175792 RepID=A0AA88SDC8_TACVA|nr:hypothetical protein Q7C36_017710 [Tachysurus vachellii]
MGCYGSESRVGLRDPKQDVPEELLHVTADSSSVPRLECALQSLASVAAVRPRPRDLWGEDLKCQALLRARSVRVSGPRNALLIVIESKGEGAKGVKTG